MMSEDHQAIQGLWKREYIQSKGQSVSSSATHWEFKGDQVQQIVPSYVDGGTWATFALDPNTMPKHLDMTYTTMNAKTGETVTRTYKHVYELDGDMLRVGGAIASGGYPEKIDDAISMVTTLSRDKGSRPHTKQASGKKPIESPVLGTVTWNDNLEQWEATIVLGPEQKVRMTSRGDEGESNQAVTLAEALIAWTREHEPEVRAYAAAKMEDIAEDWRDEDEDPDPITPEAFAARIKLEALSSEEDGSASFWYDDDEIFAGHVIVVSVSPEREFTDAQMMG